MFGTLQYYVVIALSVALFALELWAFVDALTRRPQAFTLAGKRTKPFWLVLTGIAALVGFAAMPPAHALSPFGIFSIAAVVVAAVYLVDVRPAVRLHRPRDDAPRGW